MNTISKLVTLNDAGTAATVADAEVLDIITTIFSPNEQLTGWYGIIQKVGLVVGGHVLANKRHTGSYANFSGANSYF